LYKNIKKAKYILSLNNNKVKWRRGFFVQFFDILIWKLYDGGGKRGCNIFKMCYSSCRTDGELFLDWRHDV
jgi:hypothetical protein